MAVNRFLRTGKKSLFAIPKSSATCWKNFSETQTRTRVFLSVQTTWSTKPTWFLEQFDRSVVSSCGSKWQYPLNFIFHILQNLLWRKGKTFLNVFFSKIDEWLRIVLKNWEKKLCFKTVYDLRKNIFFNCEDHSKSINYPQVSLMHHIVILSNNVFEGLIILYSSFMRLLCMNFISAVQN